MCRSLAAVKQTGNCVILANPFAFSSPLFPFSFSCSSPLAVTPTLFHQSPSTPLLPRCSMLPLPLQSESSNYALCNPLKINVYGGGRNGNVDPATTPAAVTTLCDLWNQVEREKYERKIERDVTEAFGWRVEKKILSHEAVWKTEPGLYKQVAGSSPRGLVDAENRRVHASSFVTGCRSGCDTLSACFYKSHFSYKQLGSVSCTLWWHNSGQMCSGNEWLSQATGSCALLVWLSWHNINSTQFHP